MGCGALGSAEVRANEHHAENCMRVQCVSGSCLCTCKATHKRTQEEERVPRPLWVPHGLLACIHHTMIGMMEHPCSHRTHPSE